MRIVSLLMVLAMMFSFAACSADPVNPADTTDGASGDAAATTPEESTTEDPEADNLPEMSLDGMNFDIWVDNYCWYYIENEDAEGDVVNEAVVLRDEIVSDRFDVNLIYDITTDGAWRDIVMFRQSILNGDEYDLAEGVTLYSTPIALYGAFADMTAMKYFDFEKPWWFEYANSTLRISGRLFSATGYYEFPSVLRSNIIIFNANMVEDYKLGNLYDLVKNDEWTWDKLIELADVVDEDLNSDGKMDESDRFGLAAEWSDWGGDPPTAGYSYFTQNDDGSITVTGLNDTILNIHETIWQNIFGNSYFYDARQLNTPSKWSVARDMLLDDRLLFLRGTLAACEQPVMREFGEYGILPVPMWSEDQGTYRTYSTPYIASIPITAEDYDTSSLVLEALEAEAYRQVRPAYYDVALSYKYLNDPQAVEVLDIITGNVVADMAYTYAHAFDVFLGSSVGIYENLSSWFAGNAQKYNDAMATVVDTINNLQ